MACPDRLSQWTQEVSTVFAHLSQAQRWELALWSAGIALAGAAGLTQVSALLAEVLGEAELTVLGNAPQPAFRPSVPETWEVIVLADRGLYAR